MDVFYCFHLGPVNVAALPFAAKQLNGEIIDPAEKMLEIKPGLLYAATGPYEGITNYLQFLRKRFQDDSTLNGAQALIDLRWLVNKEELDMTGYFETLTQLLRDAKSLPKEKAERQMKEFMEHPITKKVLSAKGDKSAFTDNKRVNHVRLIHATPEGCETYTISVSDDMGVTETRFHANDDDPALDLWRIEPTKNSIDKEGHELLALQKEWRHKIRSAKDEPKSAVISLTNLILLLHKKYNVKPVPLYFMESGPHTDWNWVPYHDDRDDKMTALK